MNPRATKVTPEDNDSLLLEFSNGERRQFDVSPYLDKKSMKTGSMNVCVAVELAVPTADKHIREMKSSAIQLTNDRGSIRVTVEDGLPNIMLAEFTMPKARQMDVVDKIGRTFSLFMEDYSTQSIWFPKEPRSVDAQQSRPLNEGHRAPRNNS